jgi:hypothetical protein
VGEKVAIASAVFMFKSICRQRLCCKDTVSYLHRRRIGARESPLDSALLYWSLVEGRIHSSIFPESFGQPHCETSIRQLPIKRHCVASAYQLDADIPSERQQSIGLECRLSLTSQGLHAFLTNGFQQTVCEASEGMSFWCCTNVMLGLKLS